MADQYTPLPVKGLKTNNSTAPGTDQVAVMPAIATTAAPTLTSGNEVKLYTDTSGNLRVTVANAQVEVSNDAGNPLPISATTSANTTTNPLFTQLTNGTTNLNSGSGTAANSLRVAHATDVTVTVSPNQTANGLTNPFLVRLTDGSAALNTGSGTSTGALRVAPATDVVQQISATTAANTTTNPLFTRLTDGTNAIGTAANPLFVQSDFSTGTAKSTAVTTASVAAGASTTLNGASITAGKTGQLSKVYVTASVRYKAVIESFNGTTATTIAVMFGEAYTTQYFKPVDNTLFTQAGGTGNVFRVTMTNADNVFAADLYAHIEWFEV